MSVTQPDSVMGAGQTPSANRTKLPAPNPLAARSRADALSAIALGGFLAGAIDLAYAFTFYGAQGVSPTQILQSIASGLLGMAAFKGGAAAAALGAVAHFSILIVAAALFRFAARRIAWAVARPYLAGVLFGVGIYATMHGIVVPLSAAPKFKTDTLSIATDIAVHMFLLGPAIALATLRFRTRRR